MGSMKRKKTRYGRGGWKAATGACDGAVGDIAQVNSLSIGCGTTRRISCRAGISQDPSGGGRQAAGLGKRWSLRQAASLRCSWFLVFVFGLFLVVGCLFFGSVVGVVV